MDMESRRGGVKKIIHLFIIDLQKRTSAEKLHKITKLCVRERERVCVHAESKPYFISSGEKDTLMPRLIHKKKPGCEAGWRSTVPRHNLPQPFPHLLSLSIDEAKDVFEASWDDPSQLMGKCV